MNSILRGGEQCIATTVANGSKSAICTASKSIVAIDLNLLFSIEWWRSLIISMHCRSSILTNSMQMMPFLQGRKASFAIGLIRTRAFEF